MAANNYDQGNKHGTGRIAPGSCVMLRCILSPISGAFTEVDGALARANASEKEIMVIGGEQIFRQIFSAADRLLLSYLDLKIEGPDAFFLEFDRADWTEVRRETLRIDDPNCVLIEYIRQKADLTWVRRI